MSTEKTIKLLQNSIVYKWLRYYFCRPYRRRDNSKQLIMQENHRGKSTYAPQYPRINSKSDVSSHVNSVPDFNFIITPTQFRNNFICMFNSW